MAYRRTSGILTNGGADPKLEADYIVAAAIVGHSIEQIRANVDVQFSMEPSDEMPRSDKWSREWDQLQQAAQKIGQLAALEIDMQGHSVRAGTAVDHKTGAVIVGVYGLAGHEPPTEGDIRHPEHHLSDKGQVLYDEIKQRDRDPAYQYIGLGAYTGFVDNGNVEGDTDPVGPMPSARFHIPDLDAGDHDDNIFEGWYPRWLPPEDSALWNPRVRRDTHDHDCVGWGIIGGDLAQDAPKEGEPDHGATNRSDQITNIMRFDQGMNFVDESGDEGVKGYTHGMIQAIYKAYHLGPHCTPYEITVGDCTTKLASCFGCTMFMTANGYPPTSTHLGRAESWVPLYEPYKPSTSPKAERIVINDLNASFAAYCDKVLRTGMRALSVDNIADAYDHCPAALEHVLGGHYSADNRVAVSLFLDALTVHDRELSRVRRVLGLD
ncbi:hypothetical protein [Ruegeria faecimaris]|uniref:hypothetical protein n=1 Tax=Ruegeria faecimaris TaxID=686389 RepID=UPI00232C0692|nr:hypothetical protein [Ruegeria faecimaris]